MQAHPDLQRAGLAPGFSGQGALGGERCGDCLGGEREGGLEGVADGLEDLAALPGNRFMQDFIMLFQGDLHGDRQALPQGGAALDVGEEKRDRAGR